MTSLARDRYGRFKLCLLGHGGDMGGTWGGP